MQELESRVLATGLIFGEAPRWRDGKLWVSDMHGERVVTVDAAGTLGEVVRVPQRPSGLGWLPDGRLLVVSMEDRQLMSFDGGALKPYCDLRPHCPGPANDMVVDARGRAYVGNFGFDLLSGEKQRSTHLILVEDGAARIVAKDLVFPNGMVITADGRTLIVAETFASRLSYFDVDPHTGSLGQRRLFADLAGRTPDGICLDEADGVWVACFMSGEYLRVRSGGEITHRIGAGGHRAVACMLGGTDRKTLFLLSADTDIERLPRGDSASRVEVADVEIPGAGLP